MLSLLRAVVLACRHGHVHITSRRASGEIAAVVRRKSNTTGRLPRSARREPIVSEAWSAYDVPAAHLLSSGGWCNRRLWLLRQSASSRQRSAVIGAEECKGCALCRVQQDVKLDLPRQQSVTCLPRLGRTADPRRENLDITSSSRHDTTRHCDSWRIPSRQPNMTPPINNEEFCSGMGSSPTGQWRKRTPPAISFGSCWSRPKAT